MSNMTRAGKLASLCFALDELERNTVAGEETSTVAHVRCLLKERISLVEAEDAARAEGQSLVSHKLRLMPRDRLELG